MYLGVGMPADQRNRFDLFTIKSQAKVFIKCQMHAYFENLLHSLYTFFQVSKDAGDGDYFSSTNY